MVATEVAVIMPALLIVIMLVFQVGLFWHAKQAADLAAEEAVDAAQVANATVADGHIGAGAILNQAGNLQNVSVDVDRDEALGLVTVSITGDAPSIIPFGSWKVSAQAQGSIERFIPAEER